MLPQSVLLRLEAKLRQIHAERPDLEGQEVVNMAFDVLEGEKIDKPFGRNSITTLRGTGYRLKTQI
ncbi:hypothetical protein [Streptomyces sp. NPDC055134]